MFSFHRDALSSILTAYSSLWIPICICNEFDVCLCTVSLFLSLILSYLCVCVCVYFSSSSKSYLLFKSIENVNAHTHTHSDTYMLTNIIRHSIVYNVLYRIKVMYEWQCKCSISVYRLHNLPELLCGKAKTKTFVHCVWFGFVLFVRLIIIFLSNFFISNLKEKDMWNEWSWKQTKESATWI